MPADRRDRLAAARLYLCTDARERHGDLAWFLDAVLGSGVDIVQLRDKQLEAAQELRFLEVFRASCDRHGALLAVNDRADVAYAAGADVLHLGQQDLPVPVARQLLGAGPLIGLSTHAAAQAKAAAIAPGVDYFCAGPVWATPTKPGRPAAGLGLIRYAAGLDAAGPHAAGLDAAGLDAAGLDAPGLDAPGLHAAGLDAPGLHAAGLDAAGLDAAGLDAPGLHGAGLHGAGLHAARPWFGIGGISHGNLDQVLAAGARRVVVVRAITQAGDPAAATAQLAARLRAAAD